MSGGIDIALVGVGGAVGSILRYLADSIKIANPPYTNTLFINLTGCLLIGILWAFLDRFANIDSPAYRLMITGLLGGFTTFSTFALQPINMIRCGQLSDAIIYVSLTVICGLILCWLGIYITQKIL